MQTPAFYQAHLDRVSRSFAFCIARLPQPLRQYVGLSYLLCRLVDTIEDSAWPSLKLKTEAFRLFETFLGNKPDRSEVKNFVNGLPLADIPESEVILAQDSDLLFSDFHSLPMDIRQKMERSILCMSRGMDYFSKRYANGIRLQSMTETNQYCFFVAGIVGELLTDLIADVARLPDIPREMYLKSQHFGLFLQKINILKDQRDDEKQGKFFIPNKVEFINSLKLNAHNAIQYVMQIPVQQKEFRLFCSWSLFLGLSTLSWLQNTPFQLIGGLTSKIPRWLTEQLLAKTENIIEDNAALLRMFNELLTVIPAPSNRYIPDEQLLIFRDYYRGPLQYNDLCELLN